MVRGIPCFAFAIYTLCSTGSVSAGPLAGNNVIRDLTIYDRAKGPGLAVLVMQDGKVLHRRGYGLAEVRTHRPISPRTNFQIASLTKQFTAMAAALLIDARKLGYNEKISKFFPELSEMIGDMRVRHLIHHMSGLPDYASLCASSGVVTNADVLEFIRKRGKLDFRAGREFAYSNAGYIILATLIERVSGQSFPDFFREHIFAKVGMHRSAIFHVGNQSISDRAVAYAGWPDFLENDQNPCNFVYGAGRIFSSLNDLTGWITCLEKRCLGNGTTMRNIFSAARTPRGKVVPYGFGWRVGSYEKEPLFFHEGRWVGFRSYIGYFPDRRFWIVILSNYADLSIDQTVQTILKRYLHLGERVS